MKPWNKICKSAFTGTGGTNQSNGFSFFYSKIYIIKNNLIFIGKTYIPEFNFIVESAQAFWGSQFL